jgi:outer membrane immunogenic protein
MKRIISGVVAVLALGLAVPAAAADLPAAPYTKAPVVFTPAIYDWSGGYLGLNGGWASSRKCWDFQTPAGTFVGADGCHDATGGVAGGQLGYRWQTSGWVFGLEAQGDWADLRGSNVSVLTPAFTNHSKISSFGLFTGQVGYAFNTVLLYLKGGAAVTSDQFNVTSTPTALLLATTSDQTRWGGAVGAGVEVSFALNWSVAAEYDHLFMGNQSANFTDTFGAYFSTERIRQDVDMVTVRLNYRWGGPVIAKY